MKFCRHCGQEMNQEATICLKCGISESTPVTKETAYCSNCGEPMSSQAAVCVKCGFEQKKGKEKNKDEKIYRAKDGKIIAGVCKGISNAKDINVWIVRGVFFIGNLITACALGTIAYIIAIFAIPKEE